jgi:hypothetical protein
MTDNPSTPGGHSGDAGGPPVEPGATPPGYGEPTEQFATPFPADGAPAEPERKGRRGLVIGSVAAVLAVVAGAAVWATTTLSGGGRQPDELVPKSAYAYLKIDLDPAAGQKLAARDFLSKFPKLKDGDDHPFDNALTQLLEGSGLEYEQDVKPWFDKRAAIAVYPRGEEPTPVVVLRSKDDDKARAAMNKANDKTKADGGDPMAFAITKGYVVVAEDQTALDETVRLAGDASLEDNETYQDDVDRLSGDQVAVGWVDFAPAVKALGEAVGDFGGGFPGLAGGGFPGLPGGASLDQVKGRAVLGVHFSGDYVEAEGIAVDVPAQQAVKTGDIRLLRSLPGSTVAAVSVNGLADSIKQGIAQSKTSGGPDVEQMIGGFLSQTGMSLDNDVYPLLGDQTVLAMGAAFTGFQEISAALVSHVTEPAKAKQSGEKIATIASVFGFPLRAEVKGDTFVLGTSEYVVAIEQGGPELGSTPKFTKAIGDVNNVSAAVYVDAEAMFKDVPGENLRPLKSVGFVGGLRDGHQYFRLRVTV